MIETPYTQLSNEDRELIDAAEAAMQNAYNPYNSQVMQEAANITGRDLMVLCANSDKSRIMKTSLRELLPLPYGGNWKN